MLFASYWACTPHRLAFQTSKFDLSNARVFNGYLVSIMLASAIGNLVYAGPNATGASAFLSTLLSLHALMLSPTQRRNGLTR